MDSINDQRIFAYFYRIHGVDGGGGGKYNTIGARRAKPSLLQFSDGQLSGNSSLITMTPVKKRSSQFVKNNTPYSSVSNKLVRRSLNGKQQHTSVIDGESVTTAIENDDASNAIDVAPLYKRTITKSSYNLCDDEKLSLGHMTNSNVLNDDSQSKHGKQYENMGNYCTLPRRPKTTLCSFHTIVYEKGPGKKKLGFTVVGGTDTGAIGIFIKSILPTGQAGEDGQLKAGDEILAVNGQVCHDLSHEEAVKLFKSVRCGEIALQVCRRNKPAKL